MTVKEHRLYLRRWSLSFENISANRRDPEGKTSWYSLRTPVTFRLRNGRKLVLQEKHRLVWLALLIRAYDLSFTPTHTLVGIEKLSMETGLSADSVGDCIKDLTNLGWITKEARRGTSNKLFLHLTPVLDWDDSHEPTEVSIDPDDMGYFVCQTEARKKKEAAKLELSGDFHFLEDLVEKIFPDHPTYKRADARKIMTRSLLHCLSVAGSVLRCYHVLAYFMSPTTDEAEAIFHQIDKSKNLATHLETFFPTWFLLFPLELPSPDVEFPDPNFDS